MAVRSKTVDVGSDAAAHGIRRLDPARGPLRIHPANPRHFTEGSGKAIYLTGSHHWDNFQDGAHPVAQQTPFDYSAYLDFLRQHHHNFIRSGGLFFSRARSCIRLYLTPQGAPGLASTSEPCTLMMSWPSGGTEHRLRLHGNHAERFPAWHRFLTHPRRRRCALR
jgi:hypothetical protein